MNVKRVVPYWMASAVASYFEAVKRFLAVIGPTL
jgi:hypothetical protein